MEGLIKQLNTCDYPELAIEIYNTKVKQIISLLKDDDLKKIVSKKYLINYEP